MKGKKRIQFIGFFLCLLLGNSLFVPKSYAAVAPVKVEIPVSLYAAGDLFPEEEFTVELEPVISGSNLVPDEKEIHLTLGAGKTKEEKRFAPISFSEEGTYQYDIRQKMGDTEYMTYDDREYLVSVKVELQNKDSAGNPRPAYLTAVLIVTDRNDPLKQDMKRGEIAFHNRYDKPKPPEPETPPEPVPPEPTPPNPNTPPGPGRPPRESGKPPAPIVSHDPGVLGVKKLEIFNPIEEIPKICTKIYRTARNVATGDESGMFFFGVSFSLSLFGISLYFYKRRGKDLSSE